MKELGGADHADAERFLTPLDKSIRVQRAALQGNEHARIEDHAHVRPLGTPGCFLAAVCRSLANGAASSPSRGSFFISSFSSPSVFSWTGPVAGPRLATGLPPRTMI